MLPHDQLPSSCGSVGFDVHHVAFAAHGDLRGVQHFLLGGAGHAASFDAYGVAAPDNLHVAGAGADDDLFDARGVDASGAIRPQLAPITPGKCGRGDQGEQ